MKKVLVHFVASFLTFNISLVAADTHMPWPEKLPYIWEDMLCQMNTSLSPHFSQCLGKTSSASLTSNNCISAEEMACVMAEMNYTKVNLATTQYFGALDLNHGGKFEDAEKRIVSSFQGCYPLGDRNMDGRVSLDEYEYIAAFAAFSKGDSFYYWSNGDQNCDRKVSPEELLIIKNNVNEIKGDANLNGCVDSADYTITSNNAYKDGTVGWRDGDFNSDGKINSQDLMIVSQNMGRCRAGYIKPIQGDYSQNGCVDQLDYDLLITYWGKNSKVADGNGDGIVDSSDYVLWQKNIGLGCSKNLERGL